MCAYAFQQQLREGSKCVVSGFYWSVKANQDGMLFLAGEGVEDVPGLTGCVERKLGGVV